MTAPAGGVSQIESELVWVLEPDYQTNQGEWSYLEKSESAFLPLIRELPGWIRDFPFYFSHDELCFSHCPGYPFSLQGLPSVSCRAGVFAVDEVCFASATQAARRLGELLVDHHKLIFAGNLDHKAYAWLRNRTGPGDRGILPDGSTALV